MNIKKHIPNALTCSNLFCGCMAIVFLFKDYRYVFYFIGLALVFDFLDGFVARLLKVKSDLGVQLDSLADMVSFGVVPGLIIFRMLFENLQSYHLPNYLSYAALLITVFSALRLAKFNIDTRQTESFIGLPTPANTILITSFPLILFQLFLKNPDLHPETLPILKYTFYNPYFLLIFIPLSCYLLVSEIPMFALKFKNFSWKDNKIRFIFIGLSIVLLIALQFIAIPIIIALYIILSLINSKLKA